MCGLKLKVRRVKVMGRVVNYSIVKNGEKFTKKELDGIEGVVKKYNSPPLGDLWTCEDFFWSGLDVSEPTAHTGWRISGFTKIKDNELNALMVLRACVEISKVSTKSYIFLDDEGEFMLCPVIIHDGKVRPNFVEWVDKIKYNMQYLYDLDKVESFQLLKLGKSQIPKCFADDLFRVTTYQKKEYVQRRIASAELLAQNMGNYAGEVKDHDWFISNMDNENSPFYWMPPEIFHRPINPEDFAQYAPDHNVKTVMAGFYGEYWNIGNEDVEAESLRATANAVKLGEKFGGDTVQVGSEKIKIKRGGK